MTHDNQHQYLLKANTDVWLMAVFSVWTARRILWAGKNVDSSTLIIILCQYFMHAVTEDNTATEIHVCDRMAYIFTHIVYRCN